MGDSDLGSQWHFALGPEVVYLPWQSECPYAPTAGARPSSRSLEDSHELEVPPSWRAGDYDCDLRSGPAYAAEPAFRRADGEPGAAGIVGYVAAYHRQIRGASDAAGKRSCGGSLNVELAAASVAGDAAWCLRTLGSGRSWGAHRPLGSGGAFAGKKRQTEEQGCCQAGRASSDHGKSPAWGIAGGKSPDWAPSFKVGRGSDTGRRPTGAGGVRLRLRTRGEADPAFSCEGLHVGDGALEPRETSRPA